MSLTENEIVELVEKYFVEYNVKLVTVGNFSDCHDLFKRPIIGHIVYQSDLGTIFNEPILMSDALDESSFGAYENYSLHGECRGKVLSVIPAQPGTFAICGVIPDTFNLYDVVEKYLGLEFPGSPAVDWVQVLKDLWVRKLVSIQE